MQQKIWVKFNFIVDTRIYHGYDLGSMGMNFISRVKLLYHGNDYKIMETTIKS